MAIIWIFILGGMLVTFVPMMADRSRHRPGNVAPIQLISVIGAWALLLLDASIGDRSLSISCVSFATLLTILVLFMRGDSAKVVSSQPPETIEVMAHEIEQTLGSALRTGIESVKAVIVAGSVPLISVSVPRRGQIVVRVRQDLLPWLERHRGPGGAGDAAAESLLRFTFLHELGHVLNGDHLTYRFVRSVLVAQLWWLAAAAIGCITSRDALVTILCLVPPFVAQRFLARRFLAKREEDADLRAMQTLHPADALLLTSRKPPDGGPTLLEKLMTDLQVQTLPERPAIRPLSQCVHWVWPEAGRIRERSELVVDGRGGRPPQPKRWAAWMGMQCGLLAVSILAAFDTNLYVTAIVMGWICSMAATYCGMRVHSDLVRLHDLKETRTRWAAGAIFYLSFSATALLLYLLPAFSGTLSYSLFVLAAGVSVVQVVIGSLMGATSAEGNLMYAATPLRHLVLHKGPVVLISIAIVAVCSLAAAWCFGVAWAGTALLAWAGVITSFAASSSTNTTVRAMAPMAMLHSSGHITAIRIFWRELYFDRDVTEHIGAINLSMYTAMSLFFACGAAFTARILSDAAGEEEVVLHTLYLITAVVVGLLYLIPERAGATEHLSGLEHLQMLYSLLVAAWTARLPGAAQLSEALALWVRNDATLPQAILPGPRSIWKLESLLLLNDIARAVGEEETLARWRGPTVDALRRVISGGAVSLNGRRPSLIYTVFAAQIIAEADLASEIPIEPLLDSIANQLEQWLNGRQRASALAVLLACRLLDAYSRPRPGADRIRMARPGVLGSVGELAHYVALLDDTAATDGLTGVAHSWMWETLQLNPGNDVFLLLDSYLAAVALEDGESPHLAAAELAIEEIAERMADELMKVTG